MKTRLEWCPIGLPSELAASAFTAGNEVAWTPALATTTVEWLGSHGYAVLGTELWLIRDGAIHSLPIGLSGMGEVHGTTVNRGKKEPWSAFVARAAAETIAYLQSFNPADIVEPGEVYFNVVWVSESEYERLRPA